MSENPLRILVTGGTIDKKYDQLTGELVFGETHVPEILREGLASGGINIQTVLMKDSLDMTDEDRALIASLVNEAEEERILITHGTDTMVETAGVLAEMVEGKTIVLTGAMRPYSMGESDSSFNVGFAFASAQLLPPGVYIAMNGTVFPHDNVKKNREIGRFEEVNKI